MTRRTLTDREAALLTGLADDAVDGRRLRRAEELVAELPDGHALLERQRRVSRALRTGPVAPVTLASPAVAERRAASVRWLRPAAGLAAAIVAVVVVLLGVRPEGPPTLEAVVGLGARAPEQRAPAEDGPLLRAQHAGVAFPAWRRTFGWRAIGQRSEEINGRPTRTVFYEHEGHRIAYTVISGAQLPPPAHARRVERDGVSIALYHDARHGGHEVAVFERDGRTCVLSGHVKHTDTLLKLAAWHGDSRVSF
jgi:hypothetical protein